MQGQDSDQILGISTYNDFLVVTTSAQTMKFWSTFMESPLHFDAGQRMQPSIYPWAGTLLANPVAQAGLHVVATLNSLEYTHEPDAAKYQVGP